MGRKIALYSASLIALYLGVYYYTGSGQLLTDGTQGATSVIKAFQGR